MKLNGIKLLPPEPKFKVIPHNGEEIVIEAKHIASFDAFDKQCPMPEPRVKKVSGKADEPLTAEPDFQKQVKEWSDLKFDWLVYQSIKDSPGLEFETITDDPKTWSNVKVELATFLPAPIIDSIIMLVYESCGINQGLIEEATERFLASQAQA